MLSSRSGLEGGVDELGNTELVAVDELTALPGKEGR
jgi:hypothetical protein